MKAKTTINKLKIMTLSIIILLGGIVCLYPVLNHAVYATDAASDACAGINDAFGGGCDTNGGAAAQKKVGGIFGTVLNILSYIIGGISVIMLVIGGFRYIISGGDSAGIQGAKNTIIYALVGLAIVLFAQTIVKFVIGKLAPASR